MSDFEKIEREYRERAIELRKIEIKEKISALAIQKDIIKRLAKKYKLPELVVSKIVKSPYEYIVWAIKEGFKCIMVNSMFTVIRFDNYPLEQNPEEKHRFFLEKVNLLKSQVNKDIGKRNRDLKKQEINKKLQKEKELVLKQEEQLREKQIREFKIKHYDKTKRELPTYYKPKGQ